MQLKSKTGSNQIRKTNKTITTTKLKSPSDLSATDDLLCLDVRPKRPGHRATSHAQRRRGFGRKRTGRGRCVARYSTSSDRL